MQVRGTGSVVSPVPIESETFFRSHQCFSMARISGAALLVIVALGVTPSSALRCWVCNSENDNRCGDPFQKYDEGSFLTDCNSVLTKQPIGSDYTANRQVCIKKTRRIDSYRTSVYRSCEWGHVYNLQASACSASDNNPFQQNNYPGTQGGYPGSQGSYPGSQNYGYPGQYPPPGGYQQQGGYRQGYQQGYQPGYTQPTNYRSDYGGSYGSGHVGSSYGGGSYGGYGEYCVICTMDGCNSAPHSVVVTPLTALAALLAPIATWFFARR